MNAPDMTSPPHPPPPRIPFAVHLVCYGILGLLLLYALTFRWLRPAVLEDPIQIEPARTAQIEQQIDPNTATWSELARLPGVGEATAKRIVAYREEQRQAAGDADDATGVVFRTAEDLEAINGVGDKTIERLRPHLRFPPHAQAAEPKL